MRIELIHSLDSSNHLSVLNLLQEIIAEEQLPLHVEVSQSDTAGSALTIKVEGDVPLAVALNPTASCSLKTFPRNPALIDCLRGVITSNWNSTTQLARLSGV